jgi:hypothetical protein
MATFTTHYNLEKPAGTEVVNINTFNSNSDIIDSAIFNTISNVLTGTLVASAWSGNTQTIQVSGLDTSGYVYLAFPESSSFQNYAKAGIYPSNVTVKNSITFNCTKTPTSNIIVNIIKMKVGA